MPTDDQKERLEYLRGEIRAERISYGEIAELQGMADVIDPDDVELLEWAGVTEHAEEKPPARDPYPSFPENGVCECGASDWKETEIGYTRWSTAELGEEDGTKVLRVFQDGWDDMSEGGDDHYMTCFSCFARYEIPEGVEIDYAG